jgi:hypothetical protein
MRCSRYNPALDICEARVDVVELDRVDNAMPPSQTQDEGYWAWFGFWAQFVVLGALTILGLYIGSDGAPGDYATGLMLAIGSVLLAFLRLKAWFDGTSSDWSSFLFVDRPGQLVVVIPLFTVIALAGLFIAAGAPDSLQGAGIGLFIASGLIIFLSLKRVFDKLDSHR